MPDTVIMSNQSVIKAILNVSFFNIFLKKPGYENGVCH